MKAGKGFTLVELVIVIVIIGILALAMLLSGSMATASAEASNVVSELRNMKAAAIMFSMSSFDEVQSGAIDLTSNASANVTYIRKFMDNPDKLSISSRYLFKAGTVDGIMKWFVGYDLTDIPGSVKEKLSGRAKTTSLYGGSGPDNLPATLTAPALYKAGDDLVWMPAR